MKSHKGELKYVLSSIMNRKIERNLIQNLGPRYQNDAINLGMDLLEREYPQPGYTKSTSSQIQSQNVQKLTTSTPNHILIDRGQLTTP